jgi:ribosomal protein S9
MFKTKKPIKNCLLLEFNTQKDLALAFCRVEEYYEGNPKVNGKYLSLEQFLDAFMTDDGKLNYFHYWTGFNIPGNIYLEWAQQNMSDKTKWELALANVISKKLDLEKPFYVIGGVKGDIEVIDHEIAHALYYMNPEYKDMMDTANYQFYKNLRGEYSKMVKALKKMGYGDNVIKDEVQAYMSTSGKKELVEKFGLDFTKIQGFRKLYRKVLSRYNTSKK